MSRSFKKREAIVIMNAKAFGIGQTVEGLLSGSRTRTVTDKKTSELKTITDILLKPDNGPQMAIPLDAGLRVAMSEFNVQDGEYVQFTKKDKIDWNGNQVNQYEVMVAE